MWRGTASSLWKVYRHSSQRVAQLSGWSYAHGASTTPLMGSSISRLIDEAADKYAEREAVVVCHQGIRKNFIQLREDVDRLAAGLLNLGLTKGDRIGLWGTNSYQWVLTQFAAARVGLILVNINPAYQAKELEYCLNKAQISAVVADESFKTQDYYRIFSSVVPEITHSASKFISSKRVPSVKCLILMSKRDLNGTIKFEEVLNAGGSSEQNMVMQLRDQIDPDDAINIQFTSGTTGNPKGATLSHHGLINNSYYIGRILGYNTEYHRICVSVPLYHCFGCVVGTLNILTNGVCTVFPAPIFESEPCLKAIDHEKCTSVYGTPTMFVDMINHPKFSQYSYSSVKTGIMTGAPCPEELVKQVVDKMHAKDFVVIYGATETSPVITAGRVGDSLISRATKVGKPIDHVEVKVVDENNRLVPFGQPGELCTRGFHTMLGYWDDDAKTKEVLTNTGWYHSGDVCVMEEDGYVRIVGRKKDMVIRGGENIYPREIEDFLHTHPLIAEAHVIGVPDERMGEELCVWIRVKQNEKLTQEDVKSFCKGKISHFKIPKYVKFVTSYPTTVTGKIQKFKMREQMMKEMHL